MTTLFLAAGAFAALALLYRVLHFALVLAIVAAGFLVLGNIEDWEVPSGAPFPAKAEQRPTNPRSFWLAKKAMMAAVYRDASSRRTLYCGCRFGHDKQISFAECGFTPRRESRRSHRVEFEHLVPAARFGSHRECWTTGHPKCPKPGRSCCERKGVDGEFFMMASDMHNLVPSIGEVNARRSNHPYGETPETDDYGACDFDVVDQVAEPADGVRGDVARAWLYLGEAYGMPISAAERTMFEAWHQNDPPSAWELERNRRIGELQGNLNLLIGGVE